MVGWRRALGVVAAPAVLVGCGSASSSTVPEPTASHPSEVLVFVVENHSLDEMRARMPWTAALADRYG